jgi:hypothetical protein
MYRIYKWVWWVCGGVWVVFYIFYKKYKEKI